MVALRSRAVASRSEVAPVPRRPIQAAFLAFAAHEDWRPEFDQGSRDFIGTTDKVSAFVADHELGGIGRNY